MEFRAVTHECPRQLISCVARPWQDSAVDMVGQSALRRRELEPKMAGPLSERGVDVVDLTDALASFYPESKVDSSGDGSGLARRTDAVPTTPVTVERPARLPRLYLWLLAFLGAVAVGGAAFMAMRIQSPTAATGDSGTVFVETEPSGAEVWVMGRPAGHTPMRLSLARGSREIELRYEDRVRVLPLTVAPQETVRLWVELAPHPSEPPTLHTADPLGTGLTVAASSVGQLGSGGERLRADASRQKRAP